MRRKLDFTLTIEDAWEGFLAQDRRCALTGWPLVMGVDASIDRIRSSEGYVAGNVQWLHKEINALKSNRRDTDLVQLCRAVVAWADRAEGS